MPPTKSSPLICLAFVLIPHAHAGSLFEEQCRLIERSFALNEIEALQNIDTQLPRWSALKQFRLAAAHIPADNRRQALQAIRKGLATVSAQLKENPHDVEMLLLGAMLDGQYLLLQPWRYFWNGRRGLRRVARAERLDPENPRIALVRGTAKFILPRFLGGSAREAETIFAQALAGQRVADMRFDQTPVCLDGEWGQVDLINWLARAQTKLGKEKLAQSTFLQASQYSPGNYWVDLALKGEGYEWTQEE